MTIIYNKFKQHRNRSMLVPGFELSFKEWWDIWEKSGHWDERGKCKGQYVMSRVDDMGPYKVGNVFIQTNTQNIKDSWTTAQRGNRNSPETIAKRVATYKATIQKKIISLGPV
jgi:hypothetical protein